MHDQQDLHDPLDNFFIPVFVESNRFFVILGLSKYNEEV